ncbi:MAG: hypothetical protein JO131_00970, partial [Gammaproteobacteria bacterium]|nr:hypothetical protein [Gammaproteobacteria bacterium]
LVKRSLHLYFKGLPRVFFFSLILSIIIFSPRLSALMTGQKIDIYFLQGNARLWLIPILELCVLFIFTAMLWRMRCVLYQENESILSDMRIALRKLPNIVVVAIIQGIIISFLITSSLIFGFYTQTMSVSSDAIHLQGPPFFTAIFLAFNAWLAVYIYNLLIFYLPLILTENKGILTSIEKSILLVWRNWWRTFIFLLIPWFSYIVILLFIRNIFHLALNIYFVTPLFEPSWFATILHIFLFAIFIPWVAAALLIQLRDLELRKKVTMSSLT